jgi:hypothetical protein
VGAIVTGAKVKAGLLEGALERGVEADTGTVLDSGTVLDAVGVEVWYCICVIVERKKNWGWATHHRYIVFDAVGTGRRRRWRGPGRTPRGLVWSTGT